LRISHCSVVPRQEFRYLGPGEAYEQSKWRLGGRAFEPDVWRRADVQGRFWRF
jgi:hypothetical protein